ncbi:hypothetical protein BBO99_00002938 [Phytophthora kernoviae]|uniref:Uncharacterized protein n=2 Tax=Phytophthora kernoviae TaxID=325452 RepID=A0A421FF71_9STRA|nr:hypothetical protein G195_003994 [Phytophthora kernoviae 00238/432]KAG2527060.1 hypothetical protein JM16_002904 [Phytophthora kernoviae]KAG2530036.1 hypothetical protein JM18_002448 [Phytophthora kernoviae]RLN43921.1 hypothetical protein BBI17_002853 [Phytophthora kernoviae]RLN82414.1 hypothetical protein BBO99_00002938 [Phytophthora kernoviae]
MGITAANGGGATTSVGASSNSKTASKQVKKAKKSRKPLHIAPPRMKSRRKAREVTTQFHRLTHELDRLKQQKPTNAEQKETHNGRVAEINVQLDALGGRQAYQDASILSTSFHKTSKWVFQLLTRFELRPKAKQPALRVLEVGAINNQLLSCPWLDVRAIDLNSRHEKIEQRDFFSLKPAGEFQVVVSSMLMTYARFTKILEAVGFKVRETKDSPKVAFFCLERTETPNAAASFPQKLLVPGDKRNDFSVVI